MLITALHQPFHIYPSEPMAAFSLEPLSIFQADFDIENLDDKDAILNYLDPSVDISDGTYLTFLLRREAHIVLTALLIDGASFIADRDVITETAPRELTVRLPAFPDNQHIGIRWALYAVTPVTGIGAMIIHRGKLHPCDWQDDIEKGKPWMPDEYVIHTDTIHAGTGFPT